MALVARKISDAKICATRRRLIAVKKKYDHPKYMYVAVMLENPSMLHVKENGSLMNGDE